MAEFGTPEKFIEPEKFNPFVEPLRKPVTEGGIDTLIPVTFDADKYVAEKLAVQDAVRQLGYSARVHDSDYEEGSKRAKVRTVFRIRPARKGKDSGENTPEDEAETASE